MGIAGSSIGSSGTLVVIMSSLSNSVISIFAGIYICLPIFNTSMLHYGSFDVVGGYINGLAV